tara:strand:- start:97 stop:762 length:666 start_codon:yes stop_codon:yes gene_type:complete
MDFTLYLAWGRNSVEILKPYNPLQNFKITGHLATMNYETNNKKISTINRICFFLQGPCALMDDRELEIFYEFILFCLEEYPNLNFTIREHPSHKINKFLLKKLCKYPNAKISNYEKVSIREELNSIDLSVSVFSSVIMESIALDVIPLICSFGSLPKYNPGIADKGAAIEVFNLEEAKKEFKKLLENKKYLSSFIKNIKIIKRNYFKECDTLKIIKDTIFQ